MVMLGTNPTPSAILLICLVTSFSIRLTLPGGFSTSGQAFQKPLPESSPRNHCGLIFMPYAYALTFSITMLAAVLLWGRFTFRRQSAGRRALAACAGTVGSFVEDRAFRLKMQVPPRHVPALNTPTLNLGLEYYFHSKLGLLTIAPHRELPSAVELRIGGRVWASYISAEFAANAVGSGATEHKALDALSAADRPAKLADWEQSRPHYFRS